MKTWLDADGHVLDLRTVRGWLILRLIAGGAVYELAAPDVYALPDAYRTLYRWHRQNARMHRIALSRPARLELRA